MEAVAECSTARGIGRLNVADGLKLNADLLCEAFLSRRRPPRNLIAADRELFQHEFERQISATGLRTLKDVTALPSGRLFQGWRLLPESFVTGVVPGRRVLLNSLWERATSPVSSSALPIATWVTNNWSGEYFHWLTDALPRLAVACCRQSDQRLLLPHSYARLPYVAASLAPFGVREPIFVPERRAIRVETLMMPEHTAPTGNYNDPVIRLVGETLRALYGSDKLPYRRIYVSRAKAQRRRIANESDLLPVLANFGFETVHLETIAFPDQIRLMSEAAIVVSNHGAGLTNMMFMEPGARVLEIRKAADAHNNCYFSLASAFSLPYFYMTAPPLDPMEPVHTADLLVAAKSLARVLEEALRTIS